MTPSPPDPVRSNFDGSVANADAQPSANPVHNDQPSVGTFDNVNPYAIAAINESQPVKSHRRLSVNEFIGLVITGFLAAGTAFFATCAGGAFALQGIGSLIGGPLESGLGTVIAVAAWLVIPLVVAVLVFFYVFRRGRT